MMTMTPAQASHSGPRYVDLMAKCSLGLFRKIIIPDRPFYEPDTIVEIWYLCLNIKFSEEEKKVCKIKKMSIEIH